MSNTVLIKRSGTSSVTPTVLQSGEIAINYADGKIFYKNASNTIVGAKLITGISGTANQVTVSESSGAFTLSLPNSVYVNSLFVNNIEIDTSSATPGYALAYNGTKFVPTAVSGVGGGAPTDSPTFTGTVTMPTLNVTGNSTVGTIISGIWQGSVITSSYLPASSTSATGVVQLSDSINSTSTSLAATANSVRQSGRDDTIRFYMEVL